MQRLKAEEQKLAGLENLAAESERLRVKAEEELEALRKKQEKLLAEPEGVTVADLHKVQTALESREKEARDRAATIGTLKAQTDLVRARLVELHRDLFREGMKDRTAAIVEAAGEVAHRTLGLLEELTREARERVFEPNATFQQETRAVLDTREGKAQRVADRLRQIVDWTAQTRQGLEILIEEATR